MWLPSALLSPSSKSKKTKQTLKYFLIFSQKSVSDISGKETFLYFLKKKKNFLILQETETLISGSNFPSSKNEKKKHS